MIYFKTDNTEYPASIAGKTIDREWDNRASKSVTLEMTYAEAAQIFTDGLTWSIVQRETVPVYDENGEQTGQTEQTEQEWDNSEYCVAGSITDHRDGTLTCKMGQYTQMERLLMEIREDLT